MGAYFCTLEGWVLSRVPPSTDSGVKHQLRMFIAVCWIFLPCAFGFFTWVSLAVTAGDPDPEAITLYVIALLVVPLAAVSPFWVTGSPHVVKQRFHLALGSLFSVILFTLCYGMVRYGGFTSAPAAAMPLFLTLIQQLMGDAMAVRLLPLAVCAGTVMGWFYTDPVHFTNQTPAYLWACQFGFFNVFIIVLHSSYLRASNKRTQDEKDNTADMTTIFSLLSHEIRTPMQGLVGVVDLLDHLNIQDRKIKDALKLLTSSVESLGFLYDNMRDVMFQYNIDKTNMKYFSPEKVLQWWQAGESAHPGMTLTSLPWPEQSSAILRGHEHMVKKILQRLTDYAGHTKSGGIQLKMQLQNSTEWLNVKSQDVANQILGAAEASDHDQQTAGGSTRSSPANDEAYILRVEMAIEGVDIPLALAGRAGLFDLSRAFHTPSASPLSDDSTEEDSDAATSTAKKGQSDQDRLYHSGGISRYMDLYICASIVHRLGGSIGCYPITEATMTDAMQAGMSVGGSVFWFCLPVDVDRRRRVPSSGTRTPVMNTPGSTTGAFLSNSAATPWAKTQLKPPRKGGKRTSNSSNDNSGDDNDAASALKHVAQELAVSTVASEVHRKLTEMEDMGASLLEHADLQAADGVDEQQQERNNGTSSNSDSGTPDQTRRSPKLGDQDAQQLPEHHVIDINRLGGADGATTTNEHNSPRTLSASAHNNNTFAISTPLSPSPAPDQLRNLDPASGVKLSSRRMVARRRRRKRKGAAARKGAASPQTGPCVLVVDDTSLNRMVMKRMLRACGYRCKTLSGGTAAVRMYSRLTQRKDHVGLRRLVATNRKGSLAGHGAEKKADSPGGASPELKSPDDVDIILMDLQMPDMHGFETTERLREMGVRIPILAWSAGTIPSDISRAKEVGMQGYYTKPISMDLLKALLNAHLSNKEEWMDVMMYTDSSPNSPAS